jgi:hypothetical protein
MCFGILFYIKLDIGYSDNSVRNSVINVQRFIRPIPSAPRITQGEAHALSLHGNEDAASGGTATGPGLVLCPNIPQELADLWMHLGILGPLGAINEG